MNSKFNVITREKTEEGLQISLHGNIYSYHIYGAFWNELTNYIAEEKQQNRKPCPPIISMEDVKWMGSSVLPLILSSCKVLKAYYEQPIKFIHPQKDSIRNYLFYSKFNSIANGYRNDVQSEDNKILYFDSAVANSFHVDKNGINEGNMLQAFSPDNRYYSLSIEERELLKFSYLRIFEDSINNGAFGRILTESFGGQNSDYDLCVKILSEIMCNAFLYSQSESFVNIQMKSKFEYYFTVCDTGIGFKNSILLKYKNIDQSYRIDPLEAKGALNTGITDLKSFDEFFAFFTSLHHSNETERTNLPMLIKMITSVKGTVKVHFDRFLITFWGNDNFYVDNPEPYEWMNHVIKQYSYNYKISPLCIYKSRLFSGVHIEIVFEKEI